MTNRALSSVASTLIMAVLAASGCSGGDNASSVAADAGTSNSATPDAPNGNLSTGSADGSIPGADSNVPGTSVAEASASDTGTSESGPVDASATGAISGWKLTWSDEFNGPDGSAVDPTKWKHDVGGTGWGNNELEYYTDGTQNAVVQGGYLVITATKQGASQYHCSYGTCQYTSARLLTQGLFSQQYGRFEARVQMPTGKGIWPAVWMLGDNISTVSWPACGEIDFMETIGSDISTNHGSLHMPGDNPSGTFKLPNGASYADAFHTFAIEWETGTVRFYVDDQLYETQMRSSVPSGGTWEFEHPFFLLINVAVGGSWPGSPDSTTTFPQTMKVDWVRAYQKDTTEP